MKKYGVYVKFSNSEEFANLGGYFENMDNVIARTPAKNSVNLDYLKQSIMELVQTSETPEITLKIDIPWQLHRIMLGSYGSNLREIENSYNVTIQFPNREKGLNSVSITGYEPEIHEAIAKLEVIIILLHIFQFIINNSVFVL